MVVIGPSSSEGFEDWVKNVMYSLQWLAYDMWSLSLLLILRPVLVTPDSFQISPELIMLVWVEEYVWDPFT